MAYTKVDKNAILISIMQDYLKEVKSNIQIKKRILADKEWASDGSEYHKSCRREMRAELKVEKLLIPVIEEHIEFLTKAATA